MKKLFNILILLSLLLVLNVKADMGPPTFPLLEYEVSNPEGAKCYDYELKNVRTIHKYEEIIYADPENWHGDEYKDYFAIDYQESDGGHTGCFIKKTDVTLIQDDFKPSEDDNFKITHPYQIWVLKDVKIYNGPSKNMYKEIGKLPKDTKLKPEYRLGDYWYYIEYNGTKGYVSSEDNVIVARDDEEEYTLYTYADLEISDTGLVDGKTIGKIPANTKITDPFWKVDYQRYYYLEYNGVTGFVYSRDSMAEECKGGKIKTLSSLTLFDNLNLDHKKIGVVPKGSEYEVDYCHYLYSDSAYYIPELNGWISSYLPKSDDDSNDIQRKEFVIYTSPKGDVFDPTQEEEEYYLEDIKVEGYDINFEKEKTSYTIDLKEGDTKLNFIFTPNDGIKIDIVNNENIQNNTVVVLNVEDITGKYTYTFLIKEKEKEVVPVDDNKDKKEEEKGLSNKELIIIGVGAGVFVALTALVTIILVNKRKKKETEETPVVTVEPLPPTEAKEEETSSVGEEGNNNEQN